MSKPISRKIGNEIILGVRIKSSFNSKIRLAKFEGHEYVIKYIKITPQKKREVIHAQLANELSALTSLDHPNVIKTHGHSYSDYYVKQYADHVIETEVAYILLDKAKSINLHQIIYYSGKFSEKIARFYFKQILSTIKKMHDSDLSHRNLSLFHVVLKDDYNLLLTGFKFSKKISSFSADAEENKNREMSMCPQSFQSNKCSPVLDDLFSLGNILFTMLFKFPAFRKALPTDPNYKLIYEHRMEEFWNLFKSIDVSPAAKDLLSSMLAFETILRPSIADIESTIWMQGETATLEEIQKDIEKKFMQTEENLRKEAIMRKKSRICKGLAPSIGDINAIKHRAFVLGYTAQTCKAKINKIIENVTNLNATHIYSLENPADIEEEIISYLSSRAEEYQVDKQKYKVNFAIENP